MDTLASLQFIRPGFLLLLPLVLCVYLRQRQRQNASGWQRLMSPNALRELSDDENENSGLARSPLWWALFTLLVVTALAGPSFQTLPNAVASNRYAVIYLLDLSPSMLARDVKPDRISQARLKLIDLLRRRNDGESALIAYAGDAHIVAPLSDDAQTLVALIDPLQPDVMPLPGSAPESAVELALTLFAGAQSRGGDLVFITDGMHNDAISSIRKRLPTNFRLSILLVGTDGGSTVPSGDGGVLLDADGNPVIARADAAALTSLATDMRGRFSRLSADSSDVDTIHSLYADSIDAQRDDASQGYDQRHDAGYWLVLVLLPFAAYSFRRQLVFTALPWAVPAVVIVSLLQPLDTMAAEVPANQASLANKLWAWLTQSDDLRAMQLLGDGKPREAASLFKRQDWRLVALYRDGDYTSVIDELQTPATAEEFYLLGNALALTGQFADAIGAYRKVLILTEATVNQITVDTRHNLALLEQASQPDDNEETEQPEGSDATDENSATTDQAGGRTNDRANAQSQTQSGSNIGGNNTLDQGNRQDDSESGEAVSNDDGVAADATAAEQATLLPLDGQEQPAQSGNQVTAESNNNRVLNPYAEQWLRTLPQDPGGYFRRKLSYTTQLRQQAGESPPQINGETRY